MDLYTGVFARSADLAALRANPNLRPVEAYGRDYDLWVNPVAISDPSQFSPFSLQPVRQALNYLLDRNAINADFFDGQGVPHAALWHSRQPEPARHPFFFADLERAYGFDPERARSMIGSAMTEAGATFDGTWRWQGNPVVVRLIQRVEDVRFDLAGYVATQLESAGFSVELVPMNAGQAFSVVYFGPPDTGAWMVYTESFQQPWVSVGPDEWLADFHPSVGGETIWQGHSPLQELQDVATRLLFTEYGSLDERQALIETGAPLAIDDSVRVWLVASTTYAASNRVSTFVHDSASGLGGPFTPRTARFATPGGTLRIGQQSQLTQAYQPWRGFGDGLGLDSLIGKTFTDVGVAPHPHTGEFVPIRAAFSTTTAGPSGTMNVPADAIVYDTSTNTWTPVGSGTTSRSRVTFDYTFGNWHHGAPITMDDVLAQVALIARRDHGDIASRDSFAADFSDARFQSLFRGLRVLDSDTLEVYVDSWSLNPSVTADLPDVWPQVPWEVGELAMATVLRDQTRGSFNSALGSGLTWLDLSRGDRLGVMEQALSDGTIVTSDPRVPRPARIGSRRNGRRRTDLRGQRPLEDRPQFLLHRVAESRRVSRRDRRIDSGRSLHRDRRPFLHGRVKPVTKSRSFGSSEGSRKESGATGPRRNTPETKTKYAHRIVNRASEDLGLCGIGIPFCARRRTCILDVRGRSKGKGRGRWRSVRLRHTASTDTDHMHPGRVLSRQVSG